jgi:hypothetical protein
VEMSDHRKYEMDAWTIFWIAAIALGSSLLTSVKSVRKGVKRQFSSLL